MDSLRDQLLDVEAELRTIRGSMAWAYANGSGCTMGMPAWQERKLLGWVERLEERHRHLLAVAQEHDL